MKENDIKKFHPVAGLIVFKREDEYYLQTHEITRTDNGFTWGSGKPFQKDDLKHLAETLKKETFASLKLKGLLPENVLYFQPSVSGSRFIWYIEPKQHHIRFQNDIKDGNYFMPGLIFAVEDNDLLVFAFKGTKKPDANTEIFHVPLPNTEMSGMVCMGTITESRAKKTLEEEMDRWYRRFFGGVFTNAHWESKMLKKGTLKQMLAQVLNKKKFPESLLVKHKHKTLGAFFKKFALESKFDKYEEDED